MFCPFLNKKGNQNARKGSTIKRANNYTIFPEYNRLVELKCYPAENGNSLQGETEGKRCLTGKIQVGY